MFPYLYKNIQEYTKKDYDILIYKYMKAKEILEKYKISRNTLSNWVKKGWIEVKLTPSGRYIYEEKIDRNAEVK